MTLREIRRELLQAHTDLRSDISSVRLLVDRWRHRESTREEVRAALLRLGESLGAHNRREEDLLGAFIPTVDAWGHDRAEIMNERHIEEHHEIYGALVVASESSDADAAAPILQFLFARILEHMKREEEAFLGRDVLTDVEPEVVGILG